MFSRSLRNAISTPVICSLLLTASVASSSVQSDTSSSSSESIDHILRTTGAATPDQADSIDTEMNDLLRLVGFEISQTTTINNNIDTREDLEPALITASSIQANTLNIVAPGGESSNSSEEPEESTMSTLSSCEPTRENDLSSSLGQKGQVEDNEAKERLDEDEEEEDGEKCPICLDELKKLEFTGTWCSHKFHITCLDSWRKSGKSSCPTCRRKIPNFSSDSCILCGLRLVCDANCRNECGHRFHTECLKLWLKYNGFKDIKTCPKCFDADHPNLKLNLEGWLYQQHKTRLTSNFGQSSNAKGQALSSA